MGIFDSITSVFDTAVSDVLGTASGSYLGDSGGGSGPFPVSYLPSYSFDAQQVQQAPSYPVASTMPMVARAAAAGIARWSVSFPNLWQAIQKFRAQGISMTPEKLYSALKRFGPTALAGLVGAQAISELIVYKTSHKRRHMNVANTRALRRSVRRLKGFEKLSHRVSAQLGRLSTRGRTRKGARCSSCRHSPCTC